MLSVSMPRIRAALVAVAGTLTTSKVKVVPRIGGALVVSVTGEADGQPTP